MKNMPNISKQPFAKDVAYIPLNLIQDSQTKTNSLNLLSLTPSSILFLPIRDIMKSPVFIWFLFITSISFTSYIQPTSLKLSPALPIFLILCCKYTKYYLAYREHFKYEKYLNSQEVSILTGQDFLLSQSSQIKQGDIILLKKAQVVPCDCILLSLERQYKNLTITLQELDNSGELDKKTPIKEINNLMNEECIGAYELPGFIESVKTVPLTPCFEAFSAKIQLKGFPRAIIAGYKNFLRSGSLIMDCDSVLCLAVYVGKESKKWVEYNVNRKKFSPRLRKLSNLCIVCCFIYMSLLFLLSCALNSRYSKMFKDKIEDILINTIILYSNMIPLSLYIALEAFDIFNYLYINKKNPTISVKNPFALSKLGSIEYILTEKIGVLTDSLIKVRSCYVSNGLYLDAETGCTETNLFKDEDPEITLSVFNIDQLKLDIEADILNEKWVLCIAALASVDYSTLKNNLIDPIDRSFLDFTASIGIEIIEKSKKKLTVKFNSKLFTFSILARCKRAASKNSLKFLIKDEGSKVCYFISKDVGLSKPESFLLQNTEIHSVFQALCKTYFSFKLVKYSKVVKFKADYQAAKNLLINKDQRISEVFKFYYKKMDFLGIIGYENVIFKETAEVVKSIISSDIKLWIASSVNEESILSTAYSLNIISKSSAVLAIGEYSTPAEALAKIRSIFTSYLSDDKENKNPVILTESYQNILKNKFYSPFFNTVPEEDFSDMVKNINLKDFYLSVAGSTLRLAFSSRELLGELINLTFLAKGVFLYNTFPEQKRRIIKVLQENFSFYPRVLALGSSEGAFKMIGQADVGVRVLQGKESGYFSDICINSIGDLKELVFGLGADIYEKSRFLYFFSVFKVFSLGTVLFLYQRDSAYSAVAVIDYDLIVVFETVSCLVYVLSLAYMLDRKQRKGYLEGFLCEEWRKVALTGISGIAQGILMYFFVNMSLRPVLSHGYTENFGDFGCSLFILLNLSVFFQGIQLRVNRFYFISFGISLISLIILSTFIINLNFGNYRLSSEIYLSSATIWIAISVFPNCFLIINCISNYIQSSFFPQKATKRSEEFQNKIGKLFSESVNWKCAIKEPTFNLDLKNLKFEDDSLEIEYKNSAQAGFRNHLRFYCFCYFFIVSSSFIMTQIGSRGFLNIGQFSTIIFIYSILLVVSSFFVPMNKAHYLEIVYFLSQIILSINKPLVNPDISTIPRYPIYLLIFCLDLTTSWNYTIFKSVVLVLTSIYSTVLESSSSNISNLACVLPYWIVIVSSYTSLILLSSSSKIIQARHEFIFIQKLAIEVEKSSTILGYLLPEFVRKRVKEGIRCISEDKNSVSVLFCEIDEFDYIVKHTTQYELIELLNKIFERIDMLCETFGVSKIETVGKTYMACAGLKDSEAGVDSAILKISHARRAVELALSLIHDSEKFKLANGKKILFKIGINSGPVTAGIVGYHKPQFVLVGDTVNTASRMASTLNEVNSVQISMMTYELLEDTSGLSFKDTRVEAKGKGMMSTKIVRYDNGDDSKDYLFTIVNRKSANKAYSLTCCSPNGATKGSFSSFKQPKSNLLSNLEVETTTDLYKKQLSPKIENNLSLPCKESPSERKFRERHLQEIFKTQINGLIIASAFDSVLIIIELSFIGWSSEFRNYGRLGIISSGEFFMILLLGFRKRYKNFINFNYLLSLLYSLQIICVFITSLNLRNNQLISFILITYKFFLLNFNSGTLFSTNLYFNAVVVIVWLADVFIFMRDFQNICYTFAIIVFVFYSFYSQESKMRTNAILKNLADKEINKTQELLNQMMPEEALTDLGEGLKVIKRIKNATVMFADIVGFTQWSSMRSSGDVIGLLSELFKRFDKMCVEHEVYKVHTIGDCYVAMGYRNDKNRNPGKEAACMINFALSLIGVIEETNAKCGTSLGMRIGIHTGEIIGGITGTKIVRYDIYGPDVLIANKMESNGVAGKVTVSEHCKYLVEEYTVGSYEFEKSKIVNIPSLGINVNTYFVEMF